MDFFRKYKKYQWVSLEIAKSKKDSRIDSYRPNLKTLKPMGKSLPAGKWAERKRIVLPTVSSSLEVVKKAYKTKKASLGIFKPKLCLAFFGPQKNANYL